MSASPSKESSPIASQQGDSSASEEIRNELLSDVNEALHRITSFSEHDRTLGDDPLPVSHNGTGSVTLSRPELTRLRKLQLRIRNTLSRPRFRQVITGEYYSQGRLRDHAKKLVRKAVTGSSERKLRDWVKEAQVVKTVDKFSFVLGVFVLCGTEFMVLQYPQWFGFYYVVLLFVMMALRLYMYAKNRWLYFMLDFCYWCNGSCVASVLLFPNNAHLWRLNFAVSNGALLGALLAWRNSMVFHDLDKVTSIAIHLLPGLLTYIERWKENGNSPMCYKDETLDECNTIGWTGAYFHPFLFYGSWQILYILKTEIIDRRHMKADPSIQTSLRWLTRDKKNALHRVAKTVCRTIGVLKPDEDFQPESLKTKLVFWVGQLLFMLVTILPIPLLFSYRSLNTAYILVVLSTAVYNGSNYYFEVFAARYLQKLEEQSSSVEEKETSKGTKQE